MGSKRDDEILSALGQSFHTGLRKAGESPQADEAWRAISNMPPEDWNSVIGWAAWAMDVSGYDITKREPKA